MIVFPKEKPAVENLNSYYLDIQKLFEHYQGEFGSGSIHFKSPSSEGVIFFDKDELLTGVFQDKDGETEGKAVIDCIIEAATDKNFTINIHELDPWEVYFWANIPGAEKIYEDLSTEFTDLEGLIKKMGMEKLTGYIDVSIKNGKEGGLIFLNDGDIIGGSFSWEKGNVNHSKDRQEFLIQKAKESGGIFQVSKISWTKKDTVSEVKETSEKFPSNVLTMLEEFIGIFERIVTCNKKIKTDCSTLLKRKFMEQVDKYDFLDPFVGEFEYSNQKITFLGDASAEELTKGIIESVKELASEIGILPWLMKELEFWFQEHAEELATYDIGF